MCIIHVGILIFVILHVFFTQLGTILQYIGTQVVFLRNSDRISDRTALRSIPAL